MMATDPDAERERVRVAVNTLRASRRAAAIERLGGVCAKCGSTDKLQFDHIDPASKHARIAKMWTASKAKFEAELAKCQLLCEKCHREKTFSDGSYGEWGK